MQYLCAIVTDVVVKSTDEESNKNVCEESKVHESLKTDCRALISKLFRNSHRDQLTQSRRLNKSVRFKTVQN